jgi:hypothetical protein
MTNSQKGYPDFFYWVGLAGIPRPGDIVKFHDGFSVEVRSVKFEHEHG